MTRNLSTTDRVLRVVLALAAAVVALLVGATSVTGLLLLGVAVVLGGTAAVGFCPLYRLFGLSTCPVQRS